MQGKWATDDTFPCTSKATRLCLTSLDWHHESAHWHDIGSRGRPWVFLYLNHRRSDPQPAANLDSSQRATFGSNHGANADWRAATASGPLAGKAWPRTRLTNAPKGRARCTKPTVAGNHGAGWPAATDSGPLTDAEGLAKQAQGELRSSATSAAGFLALEAELYVACRRGQAFCLWALVKRNGLWVCTTLTCKIKQRTN